MFWLILIMLIIYFLSIYISRLIYIKYKNYLIVDSDLILLALVPVVNIIAGLVFIFEFSKKLKTNKTLISYERIYLNEKYYTNF